MIVQSIPYESVMVTEEDDNQTGWVLVPVVQCGWVCCNETDVLMMFWRGTEVEQD